jgi:uncharacterized protein (DUF488 family)
MSEVRGSAEICTVGHSTRPMEQFLEILRAHQVAGIVDVRTIAKSRTNPQFGEESLRLSLTEAAIGYRRIRALGGLRHPRPDSVNTAWTNSSFRGYADHMQTPNFERGLADLLEASAERRVAVLCAEAVPWRCHRSLIGDALLVRGVPVLHLMDQRTATAHSLTRFAKIDGTRITYPPEADERIALF